jgi:hypothetical protein
MTLSIVILLSLTHCFHRRISRNHVEKVSSSPELSHTSSPLEMIESPIELETIDPVFAGKEGEDSEEECPWICRTGNRPLILPWSSLSQSNDASNDTSLASSLAAVKDDPVKRKDEHEEDHDHDGEGDDEGDDDKGKEREPSMTNHSFVLEGKCCANVSTAAWNLVLPPVLQSLTVVQSLQMGWNMSTKERILLDLKTGRVEVSAVTPIQDITANEDDDEDEDEQQHQHQHQHKSHGHDPKARGGWRWRVADPFPLNLWGDATEGRREIDSLHWIIDSCATAPNSEEEKKESENDREQERENEINRYRYRLWVQIGESKVRLLEVWHSGLRRKDGEEGIFQQEETKAAPERQAAMTGSHVHPTQLGWPHWQCTVSSQAIELQNPANLTLTYRPNNLSSSSSSSSLGKESEALEHALVGITSDGEQEPQEPPEPPEPQEQEPPESHPLLAMLGIAPELRQTCLEISRGIIPFPRITIDILVDYPSAYAGRGSGSPLRGAAYIAVTALLVMGACFSMSIALALLRAPLWQFMGHISLASSLFALVHAPHPDSGTSLNHITWLPGATRAFYLSALGVLMFGGLLLASACEMITPSLIPLTPHGALYVVPWMVQTGGPLSATCLDLKGLILYGWRIPFVLEWITVVAAPFAVVLLPWAMLLGILPRPGTLCHVLLERCNALCFGESSSTSPLQACYSLSLNALATLLFTRSSVWLMQQLAWAANSVGSILLALSMSLCLNCLVHVTVWLSPLPNVRLWSHYQTAVQSLGWRGKASAWIRQQSRVFIPQLLVGGLGTLLGSLLYVGLLSLAVWWGNINSLGGGGSEPATMGSILALVQQFWMLGGGLLYLLWTLLGDLGHQLVSEARPLGLFADAFLPHPSRLATRLQGLASHAGWPLLWSIYLAPFPVFATTVTPLSLFASSASSSTLSIESGNGDAWLLWLSGAAGCALYRMTLLSTLTLAGSRHCAWVFCLTALLSIFDWRAWTVTPLLDLWLVHLCVALVEGCLEKLRFIFIYTSPFSGETLFLPVLLLISVGNIAFVGASLLYSVIVAAPLYPMVGWPLFFMSHPRTTSFYETRLRSSQQSRSGSEISASASASASASLSLQEDAETLEQAANRSYLHRVTSTAYSSNSLNAVFYEHIAHSLVKDLHGAVMQGHFGASPMAGDYFLLMEDDMTMILLLTQVTPTACSFQLRGLEFMGTYCQARELESVRHVTQIWPPSVTCRYHNAWWQFPLWLSWNEVINARLRCWQCYSKTLTLTSYGISLTNASTLLCMKAFRQVLLRQWALSSCYQLLFPFPSSQAVSAAKPSALSQILSHFREETQWEGLQAWCALTDIRSCPLIPAVRPLLILCLQDALNSESTQSPMSQDNEKRSLSHSELELLAGLLQVWESETVPDAAANHLPPAGREVQIIHHCLMILIWSVYTLNANASVSTSSSVSDANFPSFFRSCYAGDSWTLHGALPITAWHSLFGEKDAIIIAAVVGGSRLGLRLLHEYMFMMDEAAEALWECFVSVRESGIVLCDEGDALWHSSLAASAPDIMAFRDVNDPLSPEQSVFEKSLSHFIMKLTLQEKKFAVVGLNKECVRGLWAGQQHELVYLQSTHAERNSIQNMASVLRNLINQACDFPVGYPVYVSPTLTSFA